MVQPQAGSTPGHQLTYYFRLPSEFCAYRCLLGFSVFPFFLYCLIRDWMLECSTEIPYLSWWHTVQISAPEISADFWTVCHTDLVPDFSDSRFWRRSVACSISCQFLVYTWPLWRPVTGRCHCFHFVCIVWWFYCLLSIFASSMLIFGADFFSYKIASGAKSRRQKSAPIFRLCDVKKSSFQTHFST